MREKNSFELRVVSCELKINPVLNSLINQKLNPQEHDKNFQTSITPLLNTFLQDSNLGNMFNNFLVNEPETLEIPQETTQETTLETTQETNEISNANENERNESTENATNEITENEISKIQNEKNETALKISINYLPLGNNFSRYMI